MVQNVNESVIALIPSATLKWDIAQDRVNINFVATDAIPVSFGINVYINAMKLSFILPSSTFNVTRTQNAKDNILTSHRTVTVLDGFQS